jgi:glycosyltransferase involved in cell wall biosynthesis
VMTHAHTVVAGNEYLAARAREAGASRVVVLPSVVDKYAYVRHEGSRGRGIVVGWIGSPGSQALLEPLFPILEQCLGAEDRFVTVGARFDVPRLRNHDIRSWTLESEAAEVSSFDIGVMPVRDAPFERGKCGYKLIQYMAAGVPVVASPVGVNSDIVVHGETGYLASATEDWLRAITLLKGDAELRAALGAAGRRLVERRYCTQVVGPQLSAILHAAAAGDD